MQEQVAVVTGGARGLGLAISNLLKQNSYKVIVLDKDPAALSALDTSFEKLQVDLTDFGALNSMITELSTRFPKIHLLVNNAGVIHSEPLINPMNPSSPRHSYETFKKIVDINLTAVFNISSLIAEKMVKSRVKGTIINISSISAKGNVGQSAYASAKAGVNALTAVWAKELGPYGINVASVAPGFINTESTHHALNEKIIEEYVKKTPLRRLGTMDEIAVSVLFLAQNKFVSGTVLEVDGGMSI